jgi:hypothetical protein
MICLLAIVLIVLGRLCIFVEPFGVSVDESNYLTLAELVNQGEVPYVGSVDRKPPGLFWFFAAHGKIFGDWNIHAMHLSFIALTFLLGLMMMAMTGSWWSLLLFSVYSACFPREIISSNAEILMMIPSVLAVWIFVKSIRKDMTISFGILFLTCALAAIATLFKQYAALIYAPVYLTWVVCHWQRSTETAWRKLFFHVRSALASFLALFVVYALVVQYFWSKDALDEFLFYSITNGFQFIAQHSSSLNQDTNLWGVIGGVLAAWLPLWILFFRSFFRTWTVERVLYWAAFLGALSTAFLSGRYYTHYFVPGIWFLCLLVTPELARLWERAKPRRRAAILAFGFLPFVIFSIFNLERDRFSDSWSFTRDRQFELSAVAHWIRENSSEEDKILVWGMASQLYPMSKRGSGSAYVFSDFASGRLPGYKSAISIPVQGAMINYIEDILENRPKIFVDTSPAGINDYGHFPLGRFPALRAVIDQTYEKQLSLQGLDLWVLR